jgi:hypothetical protein
MSKPRRLIGRLREPLRRATKDRVHQTARTLRRHVDGLGHRRVLRDVREVQLIDPDAQNIDDERIEFVDLAIRERLDRVIESRSPTQHAEHESADEAGFADENDGRVKLLAFDAAEQLESALAIGHGSGAPARQPRPRAMSPADARGLPARCSMTRRTPSIVTP